MPAKAGIPAGERRRRPSPPGAPAFAGATETEWPRPPPEPPARPTPRDLTSGAIGPTLLAFALPTLGSSILQSLNGSINSIWVGRFLGEDALALTSNANIIMFMVTAFVFGFSMATTILVGQCFGRRDVDGARRVIGTATGTFLFVSLIVSGLGWLFAAAILDTLGTPADATPLALPIFG